MLYFADKLGNSDMKMDKYQLTHTIHLYNHELPIAKPDFRFYQGLRENEVCVMSIQWLPCGHSWDCKNFKPGSSYSVEIEPKPVHEGLRFEDISAKLFYLYDVYEVSVKSWIGNVSVESEIRKFKNCSLWENTN